jgi:hypothetical protein
MRNGHHFQLVSSDQPELLPANPRSRIHRGNEAPKRRKDKNALVSCTSWFSCRNTHEPYYQGITGVSDTARVDMGER